MGVVINDRTREAFAKINRLTEQGMAEFVETVVEVAKDFAPFEFGRLQESIASDNPKDLQFRVFTQVGYGGYQELGTAKMPPHPFIGPGIDVSINEFNSGGKWS